MNDSLFRELTRKETRKEIKNTFSGINTERIQKKQDTLVDQ